MYIRYDWEALKLEFMKGPWDTVEEFRRDKESLMSHNDDYVITKTAGWEIEKKGVMPTVIEEATLVLVDDKVRQLKKMKQRHIKMARLMQDKGKKALEDVSTEDINIDDARKILLTGLEQERAALGIGEKGGSSNLTQVNVNLPKTKFDEILDGQDFTGLLEFIADIRREKARRIGANSSDKEQAIS